MVETVQARSCSIAECQVLKTGICVEGNTPTESCPFFGRAITDDDDDIEFLDENEDDVEQPIESLRVPLPSGEALTPAEVDKFLLRRAVRFVTIVGDFDSGKTTLICELYNKFLRGSFAGHLFGGSRTLVGLEKKSHHARIDSGRIVPDTLRTSHAEGLKFFHFSLVTKDLQSRVELMISDRAGEHYQKARNNSDVVTELIEVKKAHYIVLLMDGKRIANPIYRHSAMQSVRRTLRAFLDGEALSKISRVQVVTTKIDLLENLPDKQSLDTQLEQFRDALQRDFSERLGELSFREIAARDPCGAFSPAHGVEELLTSWCITTPPVVTCTPLRITLNTEFDRLLLRTPMENTP